MIHTCFVVIIYGVKHGVGNDDWKIYTTNTGRHDFQIDLGISLLNYGIALDWTGENRPDYMRAGEFIPCGCKKCFFCINGHTSGIAHAGKKRAAPPVVEYKCGTRVKTKKCTELRVNLDMPCSSYCRMCYRNNKNDKTTSAEAKKKCKMSRLGCAICKEPICKSCWDSGYDKHRI